MSKIRSALHIGIDPDMAKPDVIPAETKATHEEIQTYVLEHNLYVPFARKASEGLSIWGSIMLRSRPSCLHALRLYLV